MSIDKWIIPRIWYSQKCMLLYHFLIPCIVIHIGKLPIEWAIVFQFDGLSTDINLVCGCALMVVWSATFPKLSLVHIVSTVVMSLSWNFPSWAEPSWGISIFELKPSWIFLCTSKNFPILYLYHSYKAIQMIIYLNLCSMKGSFWVEYYDLAA